MSNYTFTYNLVLRRNESRSIDLPELASIGQFLHKIIVHCEHRELDLKLMGKETLLSCGEAVLYHKNTFDLSNQKTNIVDSEKIKLTIKNLSGIKDPSNKITLIMIYYQVEGNIIYNNVYTNLNVDGMNDIINDIIKAGKHPIKLVFTSPNKLSSLELIPLLESNPIWLQPITLTASDNNQITLNLTTDLICQLRFYTIKLSDNIEKLGVIVYGFVV